MKTAAEQARERAESYVRDRGQWTDPLTWEEVAELLDWFDEDAHERLHLDDICARIAQVAMSKAARNALADAFEVDPVGLEPVRSA